jgi:cation transport ATPase
LRLEPRFRYALYGAFSALFVTGAAWLSADVLKDSPSGDTWQATAAWLLMLHGGAAMATLMLLGALVPLHVARAWRSARNRVSGSAMLTINAVLIATSFGLYYFGAEVLRPWASNLHIAFGLFLPVLFLIHVVRGRRAASDLRACQPSSNVVTPKTR